MKDELRVFLDQHPSFREIEDYLPTQRGKSLDGSQLELKEHRKQALAALEEMRCNFETIALLYHATGTSKTATAVMDAKRFGKRTLFLAHTVGQRVSVKLLSGFELGTSSLPTRKSNFL